MNKIRIAVFVSGSGTNLQALLDYEKQSKLIDGEIVLVVSSKKDAYALQRAKNYNKKTVIFRNKDYISNIQMEEKLINLLKEERIDLIVLAGYLNVLSSNFTKLYDHRIINVHPSLIPSFCGEGMYGLKVHEAALNYGVKVSGATVHYVNEVVDGGEIILQKAVDVLDDDTPESLQKRIMEEAEWIILPEAVNIVIQRIKRS